jgi:hypothetical protein
VPLSEPIEEEYTKYQSRTVTAIQSVDNLRKRQRKKFMVDIGDQGGANDEVLDMKGSKRALQNHSTELDGIVHLV